MKLMDSENGWLCKQVYAKEKRKAEKRGTTQAHARLMTGAENLDALAEHDFMKHWKEVMKELAPIFKHIHKEISKHDKEVAAAAAAERKTARAEDRVGIEDKLVVEAGHRARKEDKGEDKLCATMCLRKSQKANISMDYLPAVKVATKAHFLDFLKVGKQMGQVVNMKMQQLMHDPF
jgi:hypothetical protein